MWSREKVSTHLLLLAVVYFLWPWLCFQNVQVPVFLLVACFSVKGEWGVRVCFVKAEKHVIPLGSRCPLFPLILVRKQTMSLFPKEIWDERWRQKVQNKVQVVERNGNLFLKFWWVLVWVQESRDTLSPPRDQCLPLHRLISMMTMTGDIWPSGPLSSHVDGM